MVAIYWTPLSDPIHHYYCFFKTLVVTSLWDSIQWSTFLLVTPCIVPSHIESGLAYVTNKILQKVCDFWSEVIKKDQEPSVLVFWIPRSEGSHHVVRTLKQCCGEAHVENRDLETSLVVQWLRIRLPMQGTWVRALFQEDPTCHGAIKPMHHNYWACA